MKIKPFNELSELCLRCHRCCEYVVIGTPYDRKDEDIVNFFETRGLTILGHEDYIGVNKNKIILKIDFPCPHLNRDSGECDIYLDRPRFCRIYNGVMRGFDDCLWKELPQEKVNKLIAESAIAEELIKFRNRK